MHRHDIPSKVGQVVQTLYSRQTHSPLAPAAGFRPTLQVAVADAVATSAPQPEQGSVFQPNHPTLRNLACYQYGIVKASETSVFDPQFLSPNYRLGRTGVTTSRQVASRQ